MENRKFIIFLIILFNFWYLRPVFSYEVETHAYLTSEIIKFYNKNFSNKISEELTSYLIEGSRQEDNSPRWMNHFYEALNHTQPQP